MSLTTERIQTAHLHAPDYLNEFLARDRLFHGPAQCAAGDTTIDLSIKLLVMP
jgi:hypothetical protein